MSIVQTPDSYMVYQGQNLNLHSQIEALDAFQVKKYLSEKTYLYLVGEDRYPSIFDMNSSGESSDSENDKNLISGTFLRTGDMIKLGRVCLYIKEWSIDN